MLVLRRSRRAEAPPKVCKFLSTPHARVDSLRRAPPQYYMLVHKSVDEFAQDLIAHISASEIGQAISFYTGDDSDTKTTQGTSLKDTLSDGNMAKEQHFVDVPSQAPQSKSVDEVEPKDPRLNLRRCTRLFPYPQPRPRPVSSRQDVRPKTIPPVKVVKCHPSFFERIILCVNRSNTSASWVKLEKQP